MSIEKKVRPQFSSEKSDRRRKLNAAYARKQLTDLVNPTHLQVLNESHMHNVPKNSETHFKVVVVSKEFEAMSLIQRHRLVNKALEVEFEKTHARSFHRCQDTIPVGEEWP